jgi:hypothetical protein
MSHSGLIQPCLARGVKQHACYRSKQVTWVTNLSRSPHLSLTRAFSTPRFLYPTLSLTYALSSTISSKNDGWPRSRL